MLVPDIGMFIRLGMKTGETSVNLGLPCFHPRRINIPISGTDIEFAILGPCIENGIAQ